MVIFEDDQLLSGVSPPAILILEVCDQLADTFI